jgi:hypothetical protein
VDTSVVPVVLDVAVVLVVVTLVAAGVAGWSSPQPAISAIAAKVTQTGAVARHHPALPGVDRVVCTMRSSSRRRAEVDRRPVSTTMLDARLADEGMGT